jgi:hypothetical protein
MRKFTDTELDRMRDTQEIAMQDLGYIQDYTPTEDHGEELKAWTERSDPVNVGVHMKRTQMIREDEMDRLELDGVLRLPLGTEIDEFDRIRITQRFGQDITPVIYAIVGVPLEGASGVQADFIVVEPGANR